MDSTDSGGASFDVVLRGYDRRQVDERLRFLGAELAAAEQALGSAQERSTALEDELARIRSEGGGRDPDHHRFGERVERILRLAEEEAAEVRARAAEEASATVRGARAEADRLISEAAAVAQQRQQEGQRELQRLGALQEEVQSRLLGTRQLLDGHLPALQEAAAPASGRAPGAGPGRMDLHRPRRGEES